MDEAVEKKVRRLVAKSKVNDGHGLTLKEIEYLEGIQAKDYGDYADVVESVHNINKDDA